MLNLFFDDKENLKVILTDNECFKDNFLSKLKKQFGEQIVIISNSDLTISKEIIEDFMVLMSNEISKPKPNQFVDKIKSLMGLIWKT